MDSASVPGMRSSRKYLHAATANLRYYISITRRNAMDKKLAAARHKLMQRRNIILS